MPLTPAVSRYQQEIESAIQRVVGRYPEIDHVEYGFGENSFGDPAVYFTIVVHNDAPVFDHPADFMMTVGGELRDEAKTDEKDLVAYYDVVSISDRATYGKMWP